MIYVQDETLVFSWAEIPRISGRYLNCFSEYCLALSIGRV